MNRVALVSCVKSKQSQPAAAQDLYTSPLFKGMRCYAEADADAWYILSAEHGLLAPEQVVAPYEKTLNTMRKAARQEWCARVTGQLPDRLPAGARVILLAGIPYRKGLIPWLLEHGHSVEVPMEGLRLGSQRRFLKMSGLIDSR